MSKILILGGTSEASALAAAVAAKGLWAVLSYAGRVARPSTQPVPVRVGGFGGVDGLVTYMLQHGITHLVDATHPFAAQMSHHAVQAAQRAGVALVALERSEWIAEPGDKWVRVPDIPTAADALAGPQRQVFLAIGRQHLAEFSGQTQHHYLVRLVDEPGEPLPLPRYTAVIARGPFGLDEDLELLQIHGIDTIVAKNAGGTGAEAKVLAARKLGLPVIMIDRPALPDREVLGSVPEVVTWLDHATPLGV